jgi:hypothetical protein
MQKKPVEGRQIVSPHLQSFVLAKEPSRMRQKLPGEQVLAEATQKRPVVVVQSLVPHVHANGFGVVPFTALHKVGGRGKQELVEATQ